jgi:Tfp pilus assembly protein FimT
VSACTVSNRRAIDGAHRQSGAGGSGAGGRRDLRRARWLRRRHRRLGMRLAGAARTLATALRLARGRAIARNTPVEVRFDSGRGTWDARQPNGVTLEARTLPPGVAFGSLPARGRILFGALGTAENGTITLVAGPRARRVVVNQRGRVRVQ